MTNSDSESQLPKYTTGVLRKSLDPKKKTWLSKNLNRQLLKCDEDSVDYTDDQKYAREKCKFIKRWQDKIQLRKETKKQQPELVKPDPLELNLIKRALKDFEANKEKTKFSLAESTRFLPKIEPFMRKRTRFKKALKAEEDFAKPKDVLPPLVAESESESDREESSDDNLEILDGIFPQSVDFRDAQKGKIESNPVEEIIKPIFNPFSFSPRLILFQDYELNEEYSKTMQLINLHNSPLNCKLVGVDDKQLNDFFKLELIIPSKPILTGMSCKLVVTFKPNIELDIDLNIILETELGLFSVPVQLRQKICLIFVQPKVLNFGTHTVGSKTTRHFQIVNKGARVAFFNVFKASADPSKHSPNKTTTFKPSFKSISDEKLTSELTDKTKTTSNTETSESNNDFMVETVSDSLLSYEMSTRELLSPKSEVNVLNLDGIGLGSTQKGNIDGNGKVTIEVFFEPQIPGVCDATIIVETDDLKTKNLIVLVKAEAIAPSVKIQDLNHNFKICAYDHLYQDNATLINNGDNKHKISVSFPKDLKNHFEVFPQTGIIQTNAEFQLQLKFLPKETLASDASVYFDVDTGVLEFPITFFISDQSSPINTTIQAIVCTTQIEFDPSTIDFGSCYVQESVQVDISMTNMGLLTQKFGFVNLPDYIIVEPNDGFGVILAKETLKLKIIFKPDTVTTYNSNLVCKTLYNTSAKIKWTGIGIEAPLRISHSLVNFSATTLNNVTTAVIYLEQIEGSNHKSITYQFDIPDYCPVQIIPSVGKVTVKKPQKLTLIFKPKLNELEVRYEALKYLLSTEGSKSQLTKKSDYSLVSRKIDDQENQNFKAQKENGTKIEDVKKEIRLEDIDKRSLAYKSSVDTLTDEFRDRVELFSVRCFFVAEQEQRRNEPITTTLRPITLRLSCPFLKPKLKLLSARTVDFGIVCVGQKSIMSISVCNLTYDNLPVSTSVLNPHGVFSVFKKPKIIHSKSTEVFKFSFNPTKEMTCYEIFEILCLGDRISIALSGQAIEPQLIINLEDDLLNFKYVLVGESSNITFTLTNQSPVSLEYNFEFFETSSNENNWGFLKDEISTRNLSGLNPFSLSLMSSIIERNQSQTVTVTFMPDHEDVFSTKVKLMFFRKKIAKILTLKGEASKQVIYLSGGMHLNFEQDPLIASCIQAVKIKLSATDEHLQNAVCLSFDGRGCEREILINFIQTTLFVTKKPAEFNFENVNHVENSGFNLDVLKGIIEIDLRACNDQHNFKSEDRDITV